MVSARPSDAAIDRTRTLLERAGYDEGGIRAAGVDPGLGVRRPDIPVLLQALQPASPISALIRLFLLSQDQDRRDLESRLGPDVQALVEAGLLLRSGDRFHPTVALTPWRGRIVVHDPDPEGDLWSDHVGGPTPAADALAGLLVGGDVDTALDLGTGSGLLAMLLADEARSVIATDVNPAAVRYAELGARLNGLSQIEVRSGSFFEPVRDARFDRILSNPPFVISPESSLLFRYSTLERDGVSRLVIEGAADRLADGGIAAILGNWVVPRGISWLEAIRPWVEGRGCDAIVLLHAVEDPLSYAVRWNGRAQYLSPATFEVLLDRWLEHDRAEGIEAIASGAIVLRRRGATNWTHGMELNAAPRGSGGRQVMAILEGMDHLTGRDDQDLLRGAFRLAAPHRLDQSLAMRDGEYIVEPASLILDDTIGTAVRIDPDLIPVVLRLDGTQLVESIVAEVADAAGADRLELTARSVALVRAMLERGIVQPPGPGSPRH